MQKIETSIVIRLNNIFEEMGIYIEPKDYEEPLQLDSLQFVNIVTEIEQEFLIRVINNYEDYELFKSFNDFYKYIMKQI